MKMDQDHHVPLSDPALTILDEMRDGSQGELIFPNPDGGQFSENAMLAVLDRLGYGHVTVHGFRSTFAKRPRRGGTHDGAAFFGLGWENLPGSEDGFSLAQIAWESRPAALS